MNQYAPGPLAPPAVAGAQTGTEPALPHNPTTPLASGAINQSDDTIKIVLIQPAGNPSVIMIRWPDAPTITTPAMFNATAAEAMKIFGVRQHPLRPDPGTTAMLTLLNGDLSAGCLALHGSNPAERFLPSLVRLINGQARSQRDLGPPAEEEGLKNHRYLRRVCQVEDGKERALAVLNEEVEGFRLQEFSQTLECSLTRCARAETFANALVKGFSVHDNFEQHPHNNLQMIRAAVSAREG